MEFAIQFARFEKGKESNYLSALQQNQKNRIKLSYFFFFLGIYTVLELVYFKLARRANIIDRPNQRSSHITPTIRGGGIIFPVAFIIGMLTAPIDGWLYCIIGLGCIALISFLDDIKSVDSRIRFFIHGCAIGLLLWQFHFPSVLAICAIFIIFIGIVNAYNFMDGINGITALYSIITVGSFFWISNKVAFLLPDVIFWSLLGALIVFSFFNLRKKAICFSGDVGAVSLAFIICLLLVLAILATGSIAWLALVAVYLVDCGFTIFCRVLRRERVFDAHRSHFYQYLANEMGLNHLTVSCLYAGVQLLINVFVVLFYGSGLKLLFTTLFLLFVIYIIFRLRFEGRSRLFHKY